VTRYFDPGAQRSAKVRELFNRIAARYDLLNDLQSLGLHRFWKRRLVRLAAVGPGSRALDLCCGTGDVAIALARAGADVVGLDFSEAMLEVARKRTARRAQGHPERAHGPLKFMLGDALRVPFPDNTFDAVTIGYGLRNLASVEQGLAEMCRLAKPGGRLLVLDFGKPHRAWWRLACFAYLRRVVPLFGWLFGSGPDAYSYILESLEHYPAQTGVAGIMQRLHIADLAIADFLGGAMSIHCAKKNETRPPQLSI